MKRSSSSYLMQMTASSSSTVSQHSPSLNHINSSNFPSSTINTTPSTSLSHSNIGNNNISRMERETLASSTAALLECPLCLESLDASDKRFRPCPCGYQICRFCWHRIREQSNGRCPACRKIYSDNVIEYPPSTFTPTFTSVITSHATNPNNLTLPPPPSSSITTTISSMVNTNNSLNANFTIPPNSFPSPSPSHSPISNFSCLASNSNANSPCSNLKNVRNSRNTTFNVSNSPISTTNASSAAIATSSSLTGNGTRLINSSNVTNAAISSSFAIHNSNSSINNSNGINTNNSNGNSSGTSSTEISSSPVPAGILERILPSRRHLIDLRVVQRNLVYVIGIPARISNEHILKGEDFFGRYGRIIKIVVNKRNLPIDLNEENMNSATASAYVTFSRSEDASRAIADIDGTTFESKLLKATYGTTKYCSYWLRGLSCPNGGCMYLHEEGEGSDSYTKEELALAGGVVASVPQTIPINDRLFGRKEREREKEREKERERDSSISLGTLSATKEKIGFPLATTREEGKVLQSLSNHNSNSSSLLSPSLPSSPSSSSLLSGKREEKEKEKEKIKMFSRDAPLSSPNHTRHDQNHGHNQNQNSPSNSFNFFNSDSSSNGSMINSSFNVPSPSRPHSSHSITSSHPTLAITETTLQKSSMNFLLEDILKGEKKKMEMEREMETRSERLENQNGNGNANQESSIINIKDRGIIGSKRENLFLGEIKEREREKEREMERERKMQDGIDCGGNDHFPFPFSSHAQRIINFDPFGDVPLLRGGGRLSNEFPLQYSYDNHNHSQSQTNNHNHHSYSHSNSHNQTNNHNHFNSNLNNNHSNDSDNRVNNVFSLFPPLSPPCISNSKLNGRNNKNENIQNGNENDSKVSLNEKIELKNQIDNDEYPSVNLADVDNFFSSYINNWNIPKMMESINDSMAIPFNKNENSMKIKEMKMETKSKESNEIPIHIKQEEEREREQIIKREIIMNKKRENDQFATLMNKTILMDPIIAKISESPFNNNNDSNQSLYYYSCNQSLNENVNDNNNFNSNNPSFNSNNNINTDNHGHYDYNNYNQRNHYRTRGMMDKKKFSISHSTLDSNNNQNDNQNGNFNNGNNFNSSINTFKSINAINYTPIAMEKGEKNIKNNEKMAIERKKTLSPSPSSPIMTINNEKRLEMEMEMKIKMKIENSNNHIVNGEKRESMAMKCEIQENNTCNLNTNTCNNNLNTCNNDNLNINNLNTCNNDNLNNNFNIEDENGNFYQMESVKEDLYKLSKKRNNTRSASPLSTLNTMGMTGSNCQTVNGANSGANSADCNSNSNLVGASNDTVNGNGNSINSINGNGNIQQNARGNGMGMGNNFMLKSSSIPNKKNVFAILGEEIMIIEKETVVERDQEINKGEKNENDQEQDGNGYGNNDLSQESANNINHGKRNSKKKLMAINSIEMNGEMKLNLQDFEIMPLIQLDNCIDQLEQRLKSARQHIAHLEVQIRAQLLNQ